MKILRALLLLFRDDNCDITVTIQNVCRIQSDVINKVEQH